MALGSAGMHNQGKLWTESGPLAGLLDALHLGDLLYDLTRTDVAQA